MDELSIRVADGQLVGDESWVYAWLRDDNTVFYVGATRLPLGARTWLHLTSDDPEIGRIRAHYPEALKGEVRVRGWRLPETVDRAAVRQGLSAFFSGGGPAEGTMPDGTEPEVRTAVQRIAESIQELER